MFLLPPLFKNYLKLNKMINLQLIKNSIIVAKHTGQMESFSASIKNKDREFSIVVYYYPTKDVKQDIYPYFLISMKEEESCKDEYVNGKDLHKVRDIYNGFISQGIGESYIDNNLIPY